MRHWRWPTVRSTLTGASSAGKRLMLRVVSDPNVLIAARLSPRGAPARVLSAWTDGRLQLVVSPLLLNELADVLQRPKFRRWLTTEEALAFVDALRKGAVVVDDPPVLRGVTPDPDDDYLVALARACGADWLVSGDTHLTGLAGAEPPVLSPRAFVDQLG